jgi:hypothetical protein
VIIDPSLDGCHFEKWVDRVIDYGKVTGSPEVFYAVFQ